MFLSSSFRYFVLVTFFTLPLISRADTLWISKEDLKKTIDLKPFLNATEDPLSRYSAMSLVEETANFVPLDQFNLAKPDDTFWLKTTLRTSEDLDRTSFYLSFHHLTFVDLYLIKDGQQKTHRKAGAFRKKSEIAPEDNRFSFNLVLAPGTTYQVLLKVKHTKKYPPNYDFVLQSTNTYFSYDRTLYLTDIWLQGAIAILLFYASLSWLINRYRPFLWVGLFLLGIGFYSISLQPVFIDFFFPMYPETGWILILAFLHMGVIGFYLLMIDFLETKKNAPKLYRYGHYTIKGLIIFSILCVIHNSLTSNYYLTTQINLVVSLFLLPYMSSYISIVLWRKLDTSQRFLIYGILIFGLGVVVLVGGLLIFDEKTFVYVPMLSKATILIVTILFLTGINHKLRQHEREKIAALKQLNKLHTEQNSLIERKVEKRTAELRNMNGKLKNQKAELLQKTESINTLMDELNHRVKNNLQMLYSLSALQLPRTPNREDSEILNNMRGRIKAMILVNEHLNIDKDKQTVQLSSLIHEIKQHIQHIYDPLNSIRIEIDISEELQFHANKSLPFGLIVTELFTNTFKHAFKPDSVNPTITIRIHLKEDHVQFTYTDNGKGSEKLNTDSSMGISLVRDLIRQLKGNVVIDHHTGFTYSFTFPNPR